MTSEPRTASRSLLKLTIGAAIAFVILCGLGSWQVYRLGWKRDLLARIDALQHTPARPIEDVLKEAAAGRDVAFTRVVASCPGLAREPFVRLYALKDGQTGERLLSACRLPDGGSILVDRGFLPDGARAPVVFGSGPWDEPLTVTGLLRRPDPKSIFTPAHRPGGRFFARDLPAMAAALSAPRPQSYFLAVETRINPEDAALQPAPIPANIPNNHLSYVITWFGMAAALAGVYVALLRQRLRARPGEVEAGSPSRTRSKEGQ